MANNEAEGGIPKKTTRMEREQPTSLVEPDLPSIQTLPPDTKEVIPATSQHETAVLAYLAAHGPDTPMNFREASTGKDSDQWWKSMKEEINMLQERDT